MLVYFTASVLGKAHYLQNYLRIIDYLKKQGCTIIYEHIINSDTDTIKKEDKQTRLAFQRQLEQWITSCDFVVAESSFPSTSVGYEISLALHKGKPVVILYSDESPPTLLAHHADEKLICEKYTDNDLEEIISDVVGYVKGATDTRFTFFISSEMTAYLEKAAKKEHIPKSVFLRRLILDQMEKQPL